MIPETGGWILLIDVLPVNTPIPALTTWYAVPSKKVFYKGETERFWPESIEYMLISKFVNKYFSGDHNYFKLFLASYLKDRIVPAPYRRIEKALSKLDDEVDLGLEQQLTIKTPWGKVDVMPHEYNIIEDITKQYEYVQLDLAEIDFLKNLEHLKVQLPLALENIPKDTYKYKDVMIETIGEVSDQDSFYIEMSDEYQKRFCRNYIDKEERIHNWKVSLMDEDAKNFFYGDRSFDTLY